VLGEHITVVILAGIALILGSVALTRQRTRRSRTEIRDAADLSCQWLDVIRG
jgi:hypothetical protein